MEANGMIYEVHYPDWLVNVVVVKKNGKNKVCIDFTDLNKKPIQKIAFLFQ